MGWGSHSLMVFATYITGQTQFPEFTLVLMLDDVQVMYYDSISKKAVHRSQSNSSDYTGVSIFSEIYDLMKFRISYLKDHQNCTDVKPKVRLFRKPLTDSQGLQISCLATGFYPRHVNLTLFRDGQPVDDEQITGGEILPNGDGTYQMRKSLLIGEKELHEDLEKSDFGSSALSIIIRVLVFFCVAVLIITALIIWRKRPAAVHILYLHIKKNSVMRKVKPRVRLMRKTITDSQDLQISCLATGFYPCHINLTLFRDGQPVNDDQEERFCPTETELTR
ncbi:major histocompatibility complex class I-related gene protein-like [Labeo rohita]|uniref:Major histocompatibility complex class I-related gene protein-like n=1 Tax=Labeo rohita TaxID=84645 RepID=A0A498NPA9_LABRO|nr:major histocompatibility complex class I-related gene protein-like [Labeo rohita]